MRFNVKAQPLTHGMYEVYIESKREVYLFAGLLVNE